ncbi:MAG: VTT domain-containing protein [Candidatus Woesearchaeota archaeon]
MNMIKRSVAFYKEHKAIILFMLIMFGITTIIMLLRPVFMNWIYSNPDLDAIYESIKYQVENLSLVWLFVGTMVGSLVIFGLPVELLFLFYILSGANPILSIIFATAGIMIARMANYYIGYRFRHYTRHLLEKNDKFKKKFHNIQTSLIFWGNFLPVFPVDHYIVFVGASHYNFKKFMLLNGLGKLIKLIVLFIFAKYVALKYISIININFFDVVKQIMMFIFSII